MMRGKKISLAFFLFATLALARTHDMIVEGADRAATSSDAKHVNSSNDYSKKKKIPLYKQRDLDCFDRTPHCAQWARSLECRKKNGKEYMQANCRYSCNLCNTLLQPWTPSEDEENEVQNAATFSSQDDLGYTINVGVEQKLEFTDSPIHKYNNQFSNWEGQHTDEVEDLKHRIQDVLVSQQHYLDHLYADVHLHDDVYASGIDPDLEAIHEGLSTPLVETCINYHPYCANWAARGMCETKPSAMADVCAPICHICDRNLGPEGRLATIEPRTHVWFPSPFKRRDLFGIFGAIYGDRIVVDWYDRSRGALNAPGSIVERLSGMHVETVVADGDQINLLRTNAIHKTLYIWKRTLQYREFLEETIHTEESGMREQQVIVMDNFTTPMECQAILDAVKFGIGLDKESASTQRGDDGFQEGATKTTLKYTNNAYGDASDASNEEHEEVKEDVLRSSAEIFLYPTIKEGAGDRHKFAPSVERLLTKVSLLIGIPVEHVEVPIKLEKFNQGDFQKVTSHFRDAIIKSEGTRYFNSPVKPGNEYEGASSLLKTDIMVNARVMGLTLFLSDVEEGGTVTFPNLSSIVRVNPKVGRAILFPTVVSLNGKYDPSKTPLDSTFENRGETETFLVEDRTTVMQHAVVTKGAKYAVTIYFRRFPNSDEDTLY